MISIPQNANGVKGDTSLQHFGTKLVSPSNFLAERRKEAVAAVHRPSSVNDFAQFRKRLHQGGWGYLWTPDAGENQDKKHTLWIPPNAPVTFPASWTGNIYFGVHPSVRSRGTHYRSIISEIAAINCVFAEIDGKDMVRPDEDAIAQALDELRVDAEQRLARGELIRMTPGKTLRRMAYRSAQEAIFATNVDHYNRLAKAHVMSIQPEPSAIVFSGGGYHLYWLLSEPFFLTTPEERERAKKLQARWVAFVGGDDGAKDLARVLRPTGTQNKKARYAPDYPTVTFLKLDYDRTYILEQLEGYLPAAPEQKPTAPRAASPAAYAPALSVDERYDQPSDLSAHAKRVLVTYNERNAIADELRAVGYTDAGSNRMIRPMGTSDSVQVNLERNASYHHSSNDPLFGEHLRRPFDVRAVYDFDGDYEAAALAIGNELGLDSLATVAATIAYYRQLVGNGRWPAGIEATQTRRKLLDNLLDKMEHAGRITELPISCRKLASAKSSEGETVVIATPQTVLNFLHALHGTLLEVREERDDAGAVKGQVVSLRVVVSKLDTYTTTEDYIDVSILGTTGIFTSKKADDAFATGCARWAREIIEAQRNVLTADHPHYAAALIAYKAALKSKPESLGEIREVIGALCAKPEAPAELHDRSGAEVYADYRELMAEASADFLPVLGSFGLLVLSYLLCNPGRPRQQIADALGIPVKTVAKVLRKLEAWGAVIADRADVLAPKEYTLVDDVWAVIAERLPEAKTYKIGVQRYDKVLQAQQVSAEKVAQSAAAALEAAKDEAQRSTAEATALAAAKRFTQVSNKRLHTMSYLRPDLSADEIQRFVLTPPCAILERSVTAPAMPEPTTVAWYRLVYLTGKEIVTTEEFAELYTLNTTLGAGVKFAPNGLATHEAQRAAAALRLIQATVKLHEAANTWQFPLALGDQSQTLGVGQ